MATTNFTNLNSGAIKTWSKDLWRVARDASFVMQFMGKGPNSVIQHIDELTKTKAGTKAVMTLIAELEEDGVTGDNDLEGNEEEIQAFDQEIQIDQLRNANRSSGKFWEQGTVVKFRETSRDVLGYWLADRIDQLGMLTLAGVPYTEHTNGKIRVVKGGTGRNLSALAFAGDVSAPTANRILQIDASADNIIDLADAGTRDHSTMVRLDTPSYAAMVEAKAYAKSHYIRGVKGPGGEEYYHVFMHPLALAKLKLDPDFMNAVNNAGVRGNKNPVFTGSMPTVDGLIFHEHRHVYNTQGAAATTAVGDEGDAGFKWGAHNANTNGSRTIMAGAQALGIADLGDPEWNEDSFDYKNQQGIATGKMFGFKKPKYYSAVDSADMTAGNFEDFGVVAIDHAI